MAAPAVRAVGASAEALGAVTPVTPAGTLDGDLLLLFASSKSGDDGSLPTPAGWTALPAFPRTHRTAPHPRGLIAWRVKQAGDGDPTVTPAAPRATVACIVSVFGDFDPADPVNVPAGTTYPVDNASSAGEIETNDLTPRSAGELILFVALQGGTATTPATVTDYSGTDPALAEIFDDGRGSSSSVDGNASIALATGVAVGADALGSRTAVQSAGRDNIGVLLGVKLAVSNRLKMIV